MLNVQCDDFGLYVHWPFCKKKCPYCDFNSHVQESVDQSLWRAAFKTELAYIAEFTKGKNLSSIFFGGGTPSLMEAQTVASILADANTHWAFDDDIEITLEANPTSIEAQKFQDFKAAGINRVSVGVQSLNDDALQFLGREHNAREAVRALEIAQKTFDRFSFDLIYARPDQTLKEWEEELSRAIDLSKGHISLYQLTIEQGTPFYIQHNRGDFKIPETDLAADLYELTNKIMADANMPAYEVSNYAAEGHQSKHNMIYWRYDDYAGVGPGAHGRVTVDGAKYATRTHRAPDIWLERNKAQGHGYHAFEKLDAAQSFEECFMMGMRIAEGVSIEKLEHLSGKKFADIFTSDKINSLAQEGLIIVTQTHIKPTQKGMQRLNSIMSYLL